MKVSSLVVVATVVTLTGCSAARDKDCQAGATGAAGLLDKADKDLADDPTALPELRRHIQGVYDVAEARCTKRNAPNAVAILATLKARLVQSSSLLDEEEKRQKKNPNIAKRGKKPDRSAMSGAVKLCEEEAKEHLKDPESYDHANSTLVEDGAFWKAQTTYRARNSFGGMALETRTCWIQGGKVVRTAP